MTLPALDLDALLDLLAHTQIAQHDGGARGPWVLTTEQRQMLAATSQYERVYIAKGRQVGASTVICAEDAAWTLLCDAKGHRVVCAIVVDTFEKVKERIYVCGDMLRQWGAVCDVMVDEIRFPNGSRIVGLTAAGNEVGASLTTHRLHLTELPYWSDAATAYGALLPSLVRGGRCIIETTLDVIEPFAKDLWQRENDYHKLFFNVESHHEYRMDPDSITDAQWQALQTEGYTDRASAAWFQWTVDNTFGGDRTIAFRKFPQVEGHMFASAAGRWVQVTSAVTTPVAELRTTPMRVDPETHAVVMGDETFVTEVWAPLSETSGQVVIAVDTSAGLGRDRSVVMARDKRDGKVVACFARADIPTDDLAHVVKDVVAAYTPWAKDPTGAPVRGTPPNVLVEENGVGHATVLACRRIGVGCTPFTTTEESKYRGMLAARREIEARRAFGPAVLAEECDSCHVHVSKVAEARGVNSLDFRGRKDALMTLGFLVLDAEKAPYRAREVPLDPRKVVSGKAIMKARGRLGGSGGW